MSKYTSRVSCSYQDCKEWGFYGYDTLRDQRDADKKRKKWTCNRHTCMEKLITIETPIKELTLINIKTEHGMFWDKSNSGFVFGDAYKAFAKDFPEGTKLILTAKLELPIKI